MSWYDPRSWWEGLVVLLGPPSPVGEPAPLLYAESDSGALRDSVFDWRTGYHGITKPAGHFDDHGEGSWVDNLFVDACSYTGQRDVYLPDYDGVIQANHIKNLKLFVVIPGDTLDDKRELRERSENCPGGWVRDGMYVRLGMGQRLVKSDRLYAAWDGEAGEGSPEMCVILRHSRPLPDQYKTVKDANGQDASVRTIKLDFSRLLELSDKALLLKGPLDNVFNLDLLTNEEFDSLWLVGSQEDFDARTKALDTQKNAIITVGTGKTWATITQGIAAAASGDCIEAYATAGNTYTEAVVFGLKALQLIGKVANQGLTITRAVAGTVVDLGSATGVVLFENFKVYGSAGTNAQYCVAIAGTAGTSAYVRRVIAYSTGVAGMRGFSGNYFYTQVYQNCIAHNCYIGFAYEFTAIHCTAVKCDYGFGWTAVTASLQLLVGCLAAGCTTGDYRTVNALAASTWNVSADLTAPGTAAVTGFLTADFENYAGNDFRLRAAVAATTKARYLGYPIKREDYLGQVRTRNGVFYAGAHDPVPGTIPAAATVLNTVLAYGLDNELVGAYDPHAPHGTPPTWGPGEVSGIH